MIAGLMDRALLVGIVMSGELRDILLGISSKPREYSIIIEIVLLLDTPICNEKS